MTDKMSASEIHVNSDLYIQTRPPKKTKHRATPTLSAQLRV